MTLTDGRNHRHDMGPCPAQGHNPVALPTGYHEEPRPTACAICPNPVQPGRYTCGAQCHRAWLGRWSA